MKYEKDNRKRIEYDVIGNILDENLMRIVSDKVKDLVTDICNDVGKDYLRPDLKMLIMDYVNRYICEIQINEGFEYIKDNAKHSTTVDKTSDINN